MPIRGGKTNGYVLMMGIKFFYDVDSREAQVLGGLPKTIISLYFNKIQRAEGPNRIFLGSCRVQGYMYNLSEVKIMMLRLAKIALVFAVALCYSLVVFNNLTDYDSNYQFVRHVLMMDTTFPATAMGPWRALELCRLWHNVFYVSIIGWEGYSL
jgi:hypothetical protein